MTQLCKKKRSLNTPVRTGYTTGACAAAAAYAAGCLLTDKPIPDIVTISNEAGVPLSLPIWSAKKNGRYATAQVKKDAGSNIDVTHSALICTSVYPEIAGGIIFVAGEGVGICTKDGLSIPKGEPAINPMPRKMIIRALNDVGIHRATVMVSVPGGEALAAKTFNPRLGVEGGISILGTTGIVRPKCHAALKRTIELSVSVFNAEAGQTMYMVPGNIGASAARQHFGADDSQIVEVENHWGFAVDALPVTQRGKLHIVGHPGKLIKLTQGLWNTHSRFGCPVAPILAQSALPLASNTPQNPNTAEEVMRALSPQHRSELSHLWCHRISTAVEQRLARRKNAPGLRILTSLVTMNGELAGSDASNTLGAIKIKGAK